MEFPPQDILDFLQNKTLDRRIVASKGFGQHMKPIYCKESVEVSGFLTAFIWFKERKINVKTDGYE